MDKKAGKKSKNSAGSMMPKSAGALEPSKVIGLMADKSTMQSRQNSINALKPKKNGIM